MSTKNLARTVIEGGRTSYNRFERRSSHGAARASARDITQRLTAGLDAESAVFPGRSHVYKQFADKLGPARRWLQSQAGRPWDKVRSDLFARFDIRTTAGRHIVFCHLLREIEPARYGRRELWISDHGILRYEPRVRQRRRYGRYLDEPEAELRQWLGGRRVIEHGARLYWLTPTPGGGFRQHHELSAEDAARFRALPAWFRAELEGPLQVFVPGGPY
jgi:hypothetical protein